MTRRGFDARDNEHEKGARAETAASNFNLVYPSKLIERSKIGGKQGYFENLNHVIIAGFDPSTEAANYVDKDFSEGGILMLSNSEKSLIKESMKSAEGKRDLTAIQKFQDVVSYQIEFVYDLAISPVLNVSRSPGVESVLGIDRLNNSGFLGSALG